VKSCPACLKGFARVLAAAAVALALGACDLSGRVYIAFFWAETDPLTQFTCDAPNVPGLTTIVNGRYYETIAGSYTLSYSYATPIVPRTLSFVLTSEGTLLGQENVYYHAVLHKVTPPTVDPYP